MLFTVYRRLPSVSETVSDPFLAFSTEDIEGMDREVEDILSGESDSEKVISKAKGLRSVFRIFILIRLM